ncbi:MAG: UbiD family decarboxylase [Candidatus Aenigmarchaeota archaeon]
MRVREFIEHLEKAGKLKRIKREVSKNQEAAAIMARLGDTALLFENVKGHSHPVVANRCSTRELVSMGLGIPKEGLVKAMADAIDSPKEPEVGEADHKEIEADLEKLPILFHYPKDGGKYMSSSIIIANDKEYGLNASYHRIMVLGKDRIVLRILPRHFDEYIKRGLKEFAICIGSPIQVQVTAGISCGIGKSELSIANSLKETRLVELDGHKVPDAEFVIIAEFTGEEADEGPFVDLTGTYDIVRKQRVARIRKIYAKPDALYHALLPGGLEHKVLMGMPREPTIFREVSKVCDCKDVLLTPGGCSWLHGVVSISKKDREDGKKAIEAALSGHKSMKHVIVVDDDIDINDPLDVEWAIATRVQADKDVVLKPNEKGSSLDPSSDLETRGTAKVGIDATIPSDRERKDFERAEFSVKPEGGL